jgi:hypothetical protein
VRHRDENCCNKCILKRQTDFCDQKSLVQEDIEAAGYLRIFMPKFHCELNFIEFFWDEVGRHLHDNCNHAFATLKVNMTGEWIVNAHRSLGTTETRMQVKTFSSRKYKSHRHIPNIVARAL